VSAALVLLVLLSAALHAAWNAAARMQAPPGDAFAALVVAAGFWALLALPLLGLPPLAAWPWLGGAVLLNLVAMRCVVEAYQRTSFALAYPMARAAYPPLVLLSGTTFGALPGPLALAGMALVCGGLVLLGGLAARAGRGSIVGLAWAFAAAVATAGYVVCDALGVRAAGAAPAYVATISVANALVFGGLMTAEGRRPLPFIRARPLFAFGWSVASMTSYLIVIWAYAYASPALVSAVRETSVVFATLFAAVLLKERLTAAHWAASALAAAGVALIRLG
jgi:drug/metabolite transporter (DMT)-like permease